MSQRISTFGIVYKGCRDHNGAPVLWSVGPNLVQGDNPISFSDEILVRTRCEAMNVQAGREVFEVRPMVVSVGAKP